MDLYLTKRTAEVITFTLDCTGLLNAGETITAVLSVAADQGALTLGTGSVNTQALSFPDGTSSAIGTAVQVQISAGTIPSTQDDAGLGVPNLLCAVRAIFTTSGGNTREAVMPLLLIDQINPVSF